MDQKVTKHLEGSRKSKVHALYDEQGPEAAWTLGIKLKLSENTLRSWFGTWRRDAEGPKPKVKKLTKDSPPEAAPAKAEAKSSNAKVKKSAKAAEAGDAEGAEATATA